VKLKSRGLGRKELVMDFREYTVRREGDEIVIMGTIREPVHWDFSIRMCEDDLAGVAQVATRKTMLLWLLRALFKRNRHGHWSQSRDEHLAEAERRRVAAKEKFRAADAKSSPTDSMLEPDSTLGGR
jgi:hypothetical protein